MARVIHIVDALTGEVQGIVGFDKGVVTIDTNDHRRESFERGIQVWGGRRVTPADGEAFLAAVLDRYSRTRYCCAVERSDLD